MNITNSGLKLRDASKCMLYFYKSQTTLAVQREDNATETSTSKPYSEIPTVKSVPIIGSAWVYLPLIGKYNVLKLHEAGRQRFIEYGPIVRENIGTSRAIVHLYNPADVEKMFMKDTSLPVRDGLKSIELYRRKKTDIYSNPGLTVLQKEEWKEFRSKVQGPILKPKSIVDFVPELQSVSVRMLQRMKAMKNQKGEVPDFLQELYKWSFESIGVVALDTNLGLLAPLPNKESLKMIDAANKIFRMLGEFEMSILGIWKYYPTKKWKDFEKNMDYFAEIALKNVKKSLKRENLLSKNGKLTYLQSLLTRGDFTEKDAVVMATDMLLGGIDTTSHTMAFLLNNLANNPEAQEKAYAEAKSVLPSKDDDMTAEKLEKIPFIKACLKESLRLNPTVDGTSRTLQNELILSGYRIPAGVQLLYHNYVIAQNEEYYSDPKSFKPERWLRANKDYSRNNSFTFLPFGFGPRMCIGRRIAELEIYLMATKILRNFKIEYHHEEIGMTFRLINVPDKPLRFEFKDRQ